VEIALEQYVSIMIGGLMLWLATAAWRLRKKRAIPGPAAAATFDELLSKDRRAAVQIILEERTGERDPEDRDGNLPDLEQPPSRGSVGLEDRARPTTTN
jgi:hypothetical protein